MWFGMGELNLIIFFWVPGVTTTCANILIKNGFNVQDVEDRNCTTKLHGRFHLEIWEFLLVKWWHSTGCCLLSFCQELYPTVFPHSLLIFTCSGLLESQTCKHSEEWSNTFTRCFWKSCTYQFFSWFPSVRICLTFAYSYSEKHLKTKNSKFVPVSSKQERSCFLHAFFESHQLI